MDFTPCISGKLGRLVGFNSGVSTLAVNTPVQPTKYKVSHLIMFGSAEMAVHVWVGAERVRQALSKALLALLATRFKAIDVAYNGGC